MALSAAPASATVYNYTVNGTYLIYLNNYSSSTTSSLTGTMTVTNSPADTVTSETFTSSIAASAIQSVRSLRIVVSMTSGPERPDAAKGDQRSPDVMDLRMASASFAFRANNAEIMRGAGTVATYLRGMRSDHQIPARVLLRIRAKLESAFIRNEPFS
jgi:hypothetical protein